MKKYLLISLSFIICHLSFSEAHAQSAIKVLDKAASTIALKNGVKADFKMTGGMGSASGTIVIKGKKFHATTPQATIWFDGKTQWTYLKDNDEVSVTTPNESQLQAINPYNFLNLYKKGYDATLCPDGEAGFREFQKEKFDICILDVMMPKKDGFTLAQDIRQMNSQVPIIFLTARVQKEDVLEGFDKGADDYITKPFSMEELVKRVEAILRRVRGKKNRESTMYKIGRFTFDTQKQLLTIDGKSTKLTTKENELLALLCSHANEILKRNDALRTIWIDDNYFNARSMDVYITKLRKHLKADDQIEIINIHGQGYKLIVPEED